MWIDTWEMSGFILMQMNTPLLRSKFFVLTSLFLQSNCIVICYNTLLNYVKIMQYNKNWNKVKVPDLIKAKFFNIAVTKTISLRKTVWFRQINTSLTEKKEKGCSQVTLRQLLQCLQRMHKQDFVNETCSMTTCHLSPPYQAASAESSPKACQTFSAGWPWRSNHYGFVTYR